ncbi:MAG: 2,3,4,5-tetrahydropyridine-2,6-dicarboxylate N-acetyltransferase [Sedimentibacter sp.]|uniref:2,3,4,5-tetrahydropyridine-2,6-dicarboxylate N-acetyltransferase n=1 Tax=Sedimentibacter sp. TaxID=1960295 RepID=UPI0031593D31
MFLQDPYEIAKFIKEAKKSTPVKLYVSGNYENMNTYSMKVFKSGQMAILIGEYEDAAKILQENNIETYHLEYDRRNSAIPLLDTNEIQARIEPGAVIRDMVTIGKDAVVMMGAVINIGAVIGEKTMIDMNAVVGARGTIGKNVHVGAGAVIAGVLEPPSKTPVIIEDDVLIGANAVVLEGVKVGKGAVVAAGSVVTEDVPEMAVVAGSPAKIVKYKDDRTVEKTKLLDDLRG